ncbi:hypothetical protein ABPG75_004433 [Micractinium tetrahymenae]
MRPRPSAPNPRPPAAPLPPPCSVAAMPWQLDEFLAERLERGRRLLAGSEAHRGCADLRHFIADKDGTVELHRMLLDDACQPRQGLSEHEKQQVVACFLRCKLHAWLSPSFQLFDAMGKTQFDVCLDVHRAGAERLEEPVRLLGMLGVVPFGAMAACRSGSPETAT